MAHRLKINTIISLTIKYKLGLLYSWDMEFCWYYQSRESGDELPQQPIRKQGRMVIAFTDKYSNVPSSAVLTTPLPLLFPGLFGPNCSAFLISFAFSPIILNVLMPIRLIFLLDPSYLSQ
ncbi:hypothetical protein CPB86DRAFT_401980 [Serendipita vermifera]|nr:hypothetical protein CPB86DRAFT_401980 [Serendipita vermifera]